MRAGKLRLLGVHPLWVLFWAIVLAASVWFVRESYEYLPFHEDRPGQSLVERRLWIYVHGGFAIPILFLAPMQFHPLIRARFPTFHRWLGRVFLTASLLAAGLAIFLGLSYDLTGSRPALIIFGLLWIFFSGSAWFCAIKRDFQSHRRFMVRSVAVGFAFVWVRLLREGQEWLFPFIEDPDMRLMAREYVCFIVPLLIVEGAFSWWPSLKQAAKRTPRSP